MMQGVQALDRALALFDAVVADDGATPAGVIAAGLDLPGSSARRLLAAFERRGLVARVAHGRYASGPRLLALAAGADPRRRLIEAARAPLRRLALGWPATAHLGVFEHDMVTYLVKEGAPGIFTREGEQLEAYCTGIGKALLAQRPGDAIDRYLSGSFVALTAQTLTDPDALRAELKRTKDRGYAIDDREMADDVACVAVPVTVDGEAVAAISLSSFPGHVAPHHAARAAARLQACATEIARRLGG